MSIGVATLPDVVLLDVNMPGGGPEAISRLRANAPDARVLLLTSGIERGELKRALGHGARGLLLKTSAAALVLKAVRAVAAGEYWIGRDLVGDLAAEAFAPQPPAPDLTQREKQVLALAAEGYGNREIAARLGISEHTVKHHITSLFEKTGRTSRVDLAVYAMQQGIAGPDPNDPTAATIPADDYEASLEGGIAGARIVVATNHYWDDMSAEVGEVLETALADLARLGASVTRRPVPHHDLLRGLGLGERAVRLLARGQFGASAVTRRWENRGQSGRLGGRTGRHRGRDGQCERAQREHG